MGGARIRVRLQGIIRRGRLSAVGIHDFEALVDTRAPKTIASEAVARRAGIRRLRFTGVVGVTGVAKVDVDVALAMAPRCQHEPLLVGISDDVTRLAGAEVVLG